MQKSDKLADFIVQMKISGEYQNDPSKGNSATSSRENQQNTEFDKNFKQIDMKLQNMMNFMSDFFTSYQASQTEAGRSLNLNPPPYTQSSHNLLNRS